MAMTGPRQHILGVGRFGDRAAVNKDEDFAVNRERGLGHRVGQARAILQPGGGRSPDRAADSEAEMADQNICARTRHRRRL